MPTATPIAPPQPPAAVTPAAQTTPQPPIPNQPPTQIQTAPPVQTTSVPQALPPYDPTAPGELSDNLGSTYIPVDSPVYAREELSGRIARACECLEGWVRQGKQPARKVSE